MKKRHKILSMAGAATVVATATATPAIALPTFTPTPTPVLQPLGITPYAGGIGNGPSTAILPYVLPKNPGVNIASVLSVHEDTDPNTTGRQLPAGYPTTVPGSVWDGMVGIPDGLGGYKNANNDIVLFNNQEISSGGKVRDHGQTGAFVSKYTIDPGTLQVKTAEDLMKTVSYWNYGFSGGATANTYQSTPTGVFTAAFSRFCSGSLAQEDRLFNAATNNGFNGKIYFANEEPGSNGRTFGVDTGTGQAVQLPRIGLMSFENTNVADTKTDKTLVIGMDDSTPAGGGVGNLSFLRVYNGTKQSTGNFADKAGLTNGSSFALKVGDGTINTDTEFRAFPKFTVQPVSFVPVDWDQTGAAQAAQAQGQNAMSFWRTEDGAFDPRPGKQNDYYFVSTASESSTVQKGALWKLHFFDLNNLAAGGQLEMLLNGSETTGSPNDPLTMPDNIDIDTQGHLILQEDPGNSNNYSPARNDLARMFALDLDTLRFVELAQFDSDQFVTGRPKFLTFDEETSGVIDASSLIGPGWFMFDAQVHTTTNTQQSLVNNVAENRISTTEVENGQLLAMQVDWDQVFSTGPAPIVPEVPYAVLIPLAGLALAGGVFLVRRRSVVI